MDFLITGFPRSGTTWVANLLTTSYSTCYHDPLYHTHYRDFHSLPGNGEVGISCTGIWRWPDWFNNQQAKRIILHRDFAEVQESLADIGLPELEEKERFALDSLSGEHIPYRDVFEYETANHIHQRCVGRPLCRVRFNALVDMNIQPNFRKIQVNQKVTRQLCSELVSM